MCTLHEEDLCAILDCVVLSFVRASFENGFVPFDPRTQCSEINYGHSNKEMSAIQRRARWT